LEAKVKLGDKVSKEGDVLGVIKSSGIQTELDKTTRDLTFAIAEASRAELENQINMRKLQTNQLY
jgi:hypothetical protein